MWHYRYHTFKKGEKGLRQLTRPDRLPRPHPSDEHSVDFVVSDGNISWKRLIVRVAGSLETQEYAMAHAFFKGIVATLDLNTRVEDDDHALVMRVQVIEQGTKAFQRKANGIISEHLETVHVAIGGDRG